MYGGSSLYVLGHGPTDHDPHGKYWIELELPPPPLLFEEILSSQYHDDAISK